MKTAGGIFITMIMTQGQKANYTGQQAEDIIYCIMKERGLEVKRQESIGLGIYGTLIKCDFLVRGISRFQNGLIIEVKWQSVNGSVDEKYPYLVANIKKRYPIPALVVLGGGGMKPGAIEWLKAQVDGQKLIGALSLEEFVKWVMNNL